MLAMLVEACPTSLLDPIQQTPAIAVKVSSSPVIVAATPRVVQWTVPASFFKEEGFGMA